MKQVDREPQIVRCVQVIPQDVMRLSPYIDWEKYNRENIIRALVDELDKNGLIEWSEYTPEDDPNQKRMVAELLVLTPKRSQASPEGSNLHSNVIEA